MNTVERIAKARTKSPEWVQSVEDYTGGEPEFTLWALKVDFHVRKVCGFGFLDLEDVALRDWFDSEVPPAEAARDVLENSGVF